MAVTFLNRPREGRRRRKRLDLVLVERGLADSRARAQALILEGAVVVDGRGRSKAGMSVEEDVPIRLRSTGSGRGHPYVSRGGMKLKAALAGFGIDPVEMTTVDVGSSTGGFTDCLLKHGARRVYAVDVGYGQLAWSLRRDPRVVVLERTNIRYLDPVRIPEPIDLATIDVSFISLTMVLPKVVQLLAPGGRIIALVKPQFEVGKGQVGKGGIVRDTAKRERALEGIVRFAESLSLRLVGSIPSPIPGQKGNQETLIGLSKS